MVPNFRNDALAMHAVLKTELKNLNGKQSWQVNDCSKSVLDIYICILCYFFGIKRYTKNISNKHLPRFFSSIFCWDLGISSVPRL